jgi:hypothetical protein
VLLVLLVGCRGIVLGVSPTGGTMWVLEGTQGVEIPIKKRVELVGRTCCYTHIGGGRVVNCDGKIYKVVM